MKIFPLLTILVIASNCLKAQNTLFFSEYIEGSSNNKALEIFNPAEADIDLTTQSIVVQIYANGSSSPTYTIPLTGILNSGKTYVITHSSFALALPSGTVQQTSASVNFNGDDAIVLRAGSLTGTILDVIGQIGFRPTNPPAWAAGSISTLDHTLIRNPSITHGDANGSDLFNVSLEWTSKSIDDVADLGKHGGLVSIPKFYLNPENISFTTSALGIPSVSKKFILVNNDTIKNLKITAGSNFEISSDSLIGFGQTFNDTSTSAKTQDYKFFVRYNPTSGFTHTSKIMVDTIWPQKVPLTLKVNGQVTGDALVPISTIQSSAKSTPLKGVKVIIKGIVTKDLQKVAEQKGFFLQDLNPDTSALTSEGIFVFDSLGNVDVAVGNVVTVSGTADELYNQTAIKKVTSVTVNEAFQVLPIPIIVSLPLDSVGMLESYEGMLVKFTQKLAVSEVYNLGRYGEILLSLNKPFFTPTNFIDPNDNPPSGNTDLGTSNVSFIQDQIDLQNRSKILLTDDLNTQNPNPIPFIDPVSKTLRIGSTIDTLKGILAYDFGVYHLYTVNAPKINYDPRPAVPNVGAANLKVAAMNVLNFFNGNGMGGGFPTDRGATTAFELRRQKTKIVAAIKGLDADILGMMEMENDGDGENSALKELVDSVNIGQSALNKYSIVTESNASGNPGTDAIKVAMIYKISKVTPLGPAVFCNSAAFTNLGRPPLAQTFLLNTNSEKLTVIVNHFKSKGCGTATGLDADQLDGQSCWNETRKKQAAELLIFINTLIFSTKDSDVVIMGDFNAYNEEDPLDRFRQGGLQTLLENSYSFAFDGQLGALDHAFATKSLAKQLTGIDKWHINSVEPRIIDYTTAFKTEDLYISNPYRASDHDPLLIGFKLGKSPAGLEKRTDIKEYNVYPNPVKRGNILNFNPDKNGTLLNFQGQELTKSHKKGEINTANLTPGIYWLNMEGAKASKVIVTE